MIVLRIALLLGVLGATVAPASAATDLEFFGTPAVQPAKSPAAIAVEAALVAATDRGDPLEGIVLDGVRDFYAGRGFEPLWFAAEEAPPQAVALRREMDLAGRYGLDPALYATPHFNSRPGSEPERLAAVEVEFSRALARFVTHISSGRIRPSDISSLITLEPERPDIGDVLVQLASAPSVDEALAGYEPQHPQYEALKAKLAELRALGPEEERIVVPEGTLLKPGISDERVPLLRKRLGLELPAETAAESYDDLTVMAVEAFQEKNGLNVDGIIGPATLLVLNGRSREEDIAAILANMERWRWMPRDLGRFHVMVNAPEFMVRVVDGGTVKHETRVIVGTPKNPTPTFSHQLSHIIVNPYWNVPLSILKNEMMPEIRADPWGYFARYGYEVLAEVGGRVRRIDPAWVDWYRVNPRALHVRQVPGDHNALGRIKFMFPNQHSVYLHDTPTKSLFERDRRAFSHGCVRVQNPMDFADAILPVGAPQWNSSRLKDLYGSQERHVNLDTQIPVHLSYFTMTVAADGTLNRLEDIYGYDGKMTEFLGF
ncbi:MAG: L,D-transpeptidase family protein [Propylenella sp.]